MLAKKSDAVLRVSRRKKSASSLEQDWPPMTAEQKRKHDYFMLMAKKLTEAKPDELPAAMKNCIDAFYA